MSHQEYIADLSLDQLACLIEMSQDKINAVTAKKKVKCLVVSDDWINCGFYRISEPEAALKKFVQEFEEQIKAGTFDGLSIKFEKFYPDEMEGLFDDPN
jgi:hypothetical protein